MKSKANIRRPVRVLLQIGLLAGIIVHIVTGCHPPQNLPPGLVAPELLSGQSFFTYPPEAFKNNLEGTVELLVRVEVSGYVGETVVLESSGHNLLDEAALLMARTARFKPARRYGVVQEVWMRWPVSFKIMKGQESYIDMNAWKAKALALQEAAASDVPSQRLNAQQDLFTHYSSLVKMLDENHAIFPNRVILEVVSPTVRNRWIIYRGVWPLAFILYHDFMQRYPKSEYIDLADKFLVSSISAEIARLEQAASIGESAIVKARQHLLQDLRHFVRSYRRVVIPLSGTATGA